MSKRTYTGPIIERNIEWGIIQSNMSVSRSQDCHLAVDAATGDLILVAGLYNTAAKRVVGYCVSSFMPGVDVFFAAWGAIEFHVTPKAVRSAGGDVNSAAAMVPPTHCIWSPCDPPAPSYLWQRGCGQRRNFDSGGAPKDHKQLYCRYCGGILVFQSAQRATTAIEDARPTNHAPTEETK